MPVYKEGLDAVIKPTINSLKAAISHYESRGGTASIFINDDGMRAISEEEAQMRRDYYHDNNIGWVARPKHEKDGFQRKGKFKKAVSETTQHHHFGTNLYSEQHELRPQRGSESRGIFAADDGRGDQEWWLRVCGRRAT